MPDFPAFSGHVIDQSFQLAALLMSRARFTVIALLLLTAGAALLTGCGATRSTDTLRTATEQLLISDAIDRAVESMDLKPLSGQTVFLDDTKVTEIVDRNYYISTLRQQLLASGCELRDKREEADFIVEARAGAVGTDRHDLLFGLPSMNVPQIPLVQPVPAAIPEIPIAKRRDQRGIAKIAVFAYHRSTGAPFGNRELCGRKARRTTYGFSARGRFSAGRFTRAPRSLGRRSRTRATKRLQHLMAPQRSESLRKPCSRPPLSLPKRIRLRIDPRSNWHLTKN